MDVELEMNSKIDIETKPIDNTTKSVEKLISTVNKITDASKKARDALNKIYSSVPSQKLSHKEQTDIDNFAIRHRRKQDIKEGELFYSQYRHRQNQSYGFAPITSQVSQRRFSPIYDEISSRYQKNQSNMLSLVHSGMKNRDAFSFENKLAKKTQEIIKNFEKQTEDYVYKNKSGIDKSELEKIAKDLDEFDNFLGAQLSEHHKHYMENFRKTTDSLYNKYDSSAKDNYYKQQHNKRVKERYYREQHNTRYEKWENSPLSISDYLRLAGTGKFDEKNLYGRTRQDFTFTPNNEAPYGKGQEALEKIRQAQEERAKAEERLAEKAREQLNHTVENSKFLLTADAGIKKIKQDNLVSEEALKKAKEEEKESSKKMTEYQREKIRIEEEELKIKKQRADTEAEAEARRKREEDSPYNQFRQKHPELFAKRGGGNWDKRKQASKFLSGVGESVSSLGVGGKTVGYVLDTVSAFIKGVPAGYATLFTNLAKGVAEFGEAAVKAYAEIESIKTQLGVVFSSQTQAESMFGEISQYAVKSPFGIQQTTELAVLLKQSGVYASDLMDTLKMLGDTAGGNMEKMKRIANNYAQIMAIGKASMLDMRQFAYAGIPIFEAVSKELKVSQQELRKLIADGKVTADIVEKVFKDLTGVNGIFENATERGAKTLKARLQNLADAKQLAMSSWGESIVNMGATYGNDGLINGFVSKAENFYSWMQKHADVKNIDKNVNIIANSNKRIEALKSLLDYAKSTGDKDAQKLIEEAIKNQKSIIDIEKRRAILVESYDAKNNALNKYKDQYGDLTPEEIRRRRYSQYQTELLVAEGKLARANNAEDSFELTEEQKAVLIEQISVYKQLIQDMEDYDKAIKRAKETTEEEQQANRERNLLTAQNLAYDQANKAADSSGSLMSSFQELNEIYRSSDEYKEKQEKEREKTLKEALTVLKEISKHTDKEGNVDITAYSAKQFNELVGKGALQAVHKNMITPSDREYTHEERQRLVSDYSHFQKEMRDTVEKNIKFIPKSLIDRLEKNNIENLAGLNDEDFYTAFVKLAEEDQKLADEISKANRNRSSEQKNVFSSDLASQKEALTRSTIGYQVPIEANNATLDMLEKATKNAFIPLWKRIFASNTGLTAQGMVSKEQTLGNYMNDVANRNTIAGVMKATMQSMGINTAMRLLKPSDDIRAIELQGTKGYINQVDWKKSKDALKDFATQLSASTDVISAYRQGLESELDTLQNLVMHGFTDMESADIQKQKYLSVKTLSKYSSEADSQLVNALGDKLKSAAGNDIVIQEGKFFEKVEDQLKEVALKEINIDDSIVDILREWFPKIQTEIAETKMKERNNQEFEERLNDVLAGKLVDEIYNSSTPRQGKVSSYMITHPDYVRAQYSNAVSAVKQDERFKDFSEISESNISTSALMALSKQESGKELTDYEKRILELFDAILEKVKQSADELGIGEEGSSFQNLLDTANKAEYEAIALDAFNKLQNGKMDSQYSLTAYNDENGPHGSRGMSARILKYGWGLDRGYDMQSLYDQANANGGYMEISESFKKYLEKKYGYGTSSESNDVQWNAGDLGDPEGMMKSVVEETLRWKQSMEDTKDIMHTMGQEMTKITTDMGKGMWEKPFEQMGKNLMLGKEAGEGMEDVFKNLAAQTLEASSASMVKAGWELVARGAADDNWGMIAGGLALVAAGGFAAGIGGALTDKNKDKDKKDKEAEKLENLKSDLQKLLEQARTDALYYENNLRHQTALGINKGFSYKSVNDAIITPSGQVVETDPKDYLIATKTPQQLAGGPGNVTVQPVINCNVVNNSSAQVRTEQSQNADGSIDIVTIVEEIAGGYIASSRSDEAFASRDFRMQGKQAIM